jgi:hypothetical protein
MTAKMTIKGVPIDKTDLNISELHAILGDKQFAYCNFNLHAINFGIIVNTFKHCKYCFLQS